MKASITLLASALFLVPAAAGYADKVFQKGKGATWDCAKDDVVEINHGGGTYTFKGACKEINLNGGSSKLTIESVASLNLNGAQNKVKIGTLGEIVINGAKNTVTYKKAANGAKKPDVTSNGIGNSVTRIK